MSPTLRTGAPLLQRARRVDANGCSESQKDDDKDGVVNPADRCPNTPEGETPDPYGCVLSQQDTRRG